MTPYSGYHICTTSCARCFASILPVRLLPLYPISSLFPCLPASTPTKTQQNTKSLHVPTRSRPRPSHRRRRDPQGRADRHQHAVDASTPPGLGPRRRRLRPGPLGPSAEGHSRSLALRFRGLPARAAHMSRTEFRGMYENMSCFHFLP